jgi:hypothetical protein
MPELELAQYMMEPHAGTSAGRLLDILEIYVADFADFNIVGAGAVGGDGADVALHRMT